MRRCGLRARQPRLKTQVKGLTPAIEPILIVFLGGVVVIVVSVFLPMTTNIGSGS